MTKDEEVLVSMLRALANKKIDRNVIAMVLQGFIQEKGFLSDEAGDAVKEIITSKGVKE